MSGEWDNTIERGYNEALKHIATGSMLGRGIARMVREAYETGKQEGNAPQSCLITGGATCDRCVSAGRMWSPTCPACNAPMSNAGPVEIAS